MYYICYVICMHAQSPQSDSAIPWTIVHQTPLSMGYSKSKNAGVGCHALLQGFDPGIKPASSALQVDSLPTEPAGKPILCYI